MKKIIFLLVFAVTFTACKNEPKEVNLEENRSKSYDQNDGFITVKGEFIYIEKDNAAVLQTASQIYGVVVDDNMHKLNKQVSDFKKEDTDMVPVTVRVNRIKSNDPNTWEYKVEIKEILNIEEPSQNKDDVIKLGS